MASIQRAGMVWALLSVLAFGIGLVLSMVILGFLEGTIGLTHRVGLGAWPVMWGVIAIVGCLGAAELALSVRPQITLAAAGAALAGLALATATQVVLFDWSVARFGVLDSDFVGPTAGMFALLVAMATASFATFIAPASVVAWPAVVTMITGALAVAVGASNVPGLGDGIGPGGLPLAAVLASDALYAVALVVAALRTLGGRTARRPLK